MALAQQRLDVVSEPCRVPCLCGRHDDAVQMLDRQHALQHGERHVDRVHLILVPARHDADDARGRVADEDVASDRIDRLAEQLVAGAGAEHGNRAGAVTSAGERSRRAPHAIRTTAGMTPRCRAPGRYSRVAPLATKPRSRTTAEAYFTPGSRGNLVRIVGSEGRRRAEAGRNFRLFAAASEVACVDPNQVRPGRSDIVGNGFLRAAAERDHRDDRGHADRHPQGRQGGAQLVTGERAQCDAKACGASLVTQRVDRIQPDAWRAG